MQIPKKYFQDRFVLLLISINTFFALFGAAFILLRLDSAQGNNYIVQFRGNQGLDAYSSGGAMQLLSFIVFALFVLVFHTVLSIKIYTARRHFSLTVLAMGLLLLLVGIIVSNALLELR